MEELNKENINEENKNEEDITEADAGAIEESDITETVTETDAEPTTIMREKNAEDDSIQEEEHVDDDSTGADAENGQDDDAQAVTRPAHPEAALEAILFAYGNSVSAERLCEVLCLTEEELEETVVNLEKQYADEGRGINIVRLEDSFQLGTKAEYYDRLVKLAKHPKRYSLTDSVIETLSIVAYKQPVTKSEIEKIRGVSADHAINRLVEYELIEEVGRLEAPGKPLLFGTTEQFLRAFGVSSISELPEMSEDLKETFKAEAEKEALGGDNDDDDDTGIIVDI